MPFTPFHMGPGLLVKAVAGRHFSILTFGIAQVAMDIEPLMGLMRGATVLHGPTHTYPAACVIALLVAALSPRLCRPMLRRWNKELLFFRLPQLVETESFAPTPVIVGAFVGTLSHVLLDSMMHADITPLAPWSTANGLLDLISVRTLHLFCLLSGLFGVLGWLFVGWQRSPVSAGHES